MRKRLHIKHLSNLVRSLSHELFCWLSPDGWYSDHPAYVIIDNPGGGLVRELLQTVIFEEPQCMGENLQC